MMLLFQFSLFSLIGVSFFLVIAVPFIISYPSIWINQKRNLFLTLLIWLTLVFLVGGLNSFVM